MQIVVPMSGFGERFRRAGYDRPKPLIEVDGKTIIEHVVDMFDGADRFIFICNREHLADPTFRLRETLDQFDNATIVEIEPHKLGPVHAILKAADAIDPAMPTTVSYCDYTCVWDFNDFRAFVSETDTDGCVITYTGFHPHMLGSTNYAYVRAENDNRFSAIQEKQPFTDKPQSEHASSGGYYFRDGQTLLTYSRRLADAGITVNDEYYASMIYDGMLGDGLAVHYYDIPHFMQWGTPADLAEYRYFSGMFAALGARSPQTVKHPGTVLLPMAGLGSRFVAEGYPDPKPLIPVDGAPMAVCARGDLPQADQTVYVVRDQLASDSRFQAFVADDPTKPDVVVLDAPTDGQARTCLAAYYRLQEGKPLTIGACDNGAVYDAAALQRLLDDPAVDVVVWGARGYPGAIKTPQAYGWIAGTDGAVTGVSVKKPLAQPETDPIIIGTFTFRRADMFRDAAERMFEREARVNGEYYVDTLINDCIASGLNVRLFEVDYYVCWGTPDDYKRYNYWRDAFSVWPSHPLSSLTRATNRKSGVDA